MHCPSCGGSHESGAERSRCMAATIRRQNRNRFREMFGLTDEDDT